MVVSIVYDLKLNSVKTNRTTVLDGIKVVIYNNNVLRESTFNIKN